MLDTFAEWLPTLLAQALTNLHFVQQGDVLKLNLNLEDFHDDCIDLLKEPARNKQTIFNDGRNKVKKSMYPQILITLVLRLASLCVEKKMNWSLIIFLNCPVWMQWMSFSLLFYWLLSLSSIMGALTSESLRLNTGNIAFHSGIGTVSQTPHCCPKLFLPCLTAFLVDLSISTSNFTSPSLSYHQAMILLFYTTHWKTLIHEIRLYLVPIESTSNTIFLGICTKI